MTLENVGESHFTSEPPLFGTVEIQMQLKEFKLQNQIACTEPDMHALAYLHYSCP